MFLFNIPESIWITEPWRPEKEYNHPKNRAEVIKQRQELKPFTNTQPRKNFSAGLFACLAVPKEREKKSQKRKTREKSKRRNKWSFLLCCSSRSTFVELQTFSSWLFLGPTSVLLRLYLPDWMVEGRLERGRDCGSGDRRQRLHHYLKDGGKKKRKERRRGGERESQTVSKYNEPGGGRQSRREERDGG